MKILFLGDIVGRAGRQKVLDLVPKMIDSWGLDWVIVNGENAAGGFGISPEICEDLFAAGVDVISTGNHIWDQKKIFKYINQEKRLLRPLNYPQASPGQGVGVYQKGRYELVVMNAMARLFMDALDDPFEAVRKTLNLYPLKKNRAIFIDIHGEANSEKMAMGHFVDGQATCVVGTHTHIPTADAQVFEKGTAYQTDAGMCGDYNSVIGMDKQIPVERFVKKISPGRLSPALGEATICGVYVSVNDENGLANSIEPVVLGSRLHQRIPEGLSPIMAA